MVYVKWIVLTMMFVAGWCTAELMRHIDNVMTPYGLVGMLASLIGGVLVGYKAAKENY